MTKRESLVIFFDIGSTLVQDSQNWVPGAKDVLIQLRSSGIRLGLISNTGTLDRTEFIPHLPSDFDLLVFDQDLILLSKEVGIEKPDLRIFLQAVRQAVVSPLKGSSPLLTFQSCCANLFNMSRPLRIEYPDAWYHVMNRGRRSEEIFFSETDRMEFLTVMQEAVNLWNLRVSSYCLMPNHYHLLVQTPAGNLSRCMRHINGVYTQRFNRKHNKDGQLFRGRYKAILVDSDNYLLEVLRYIHRNPLKAGLVRNLDEFPWSSHRAYLSNTNY